MSKKRQSSLQPQGPGETGRWAVPQIVILGLFYHKMAVIWHFLSNFEFFVFKTSIGESECDAEGGASNFFCQNFYSENSPFTTYFFRQITGVFYSLSMPDVKSGTKC